MEMKEKQNKKKSELGQALKNLKTKKLREFQSDSIGDCLISSASLADWE
jgi:hypothetical protein